MNHSPEIRSDSLPIPLLAYGFKANRSHRSQILHCGSSSEFSSAEIGLFCLFVLLSLKAIKAYNWIRFSGKPVTFKVYMVRKSADWQWTITAIHDDAVRCKMSFFSRRAVLLITLSVVLVSIKSSIMGKVSNCGFAF